MTQTSRPKQHVAPVALVAALALVMAGCQSTRTAGVGRSWGSWASRSKPAVTAPDGMAKTSRWQFPWRRHAIENQVAAVEMHAHQTQASLQEAGMHARQTVVAAKPSVRLLMPTTSNPRRADDFSADEEIEPAPLEMPSQEQVPSSASNQNNANPSQDDSVSARVNARMNDIFQTGAELPGESMPGEVNVAYADDGPAAAKDAVDVKVDEVAPEISPMESPEAASTSMMPITEAIEEGTAFSGNGLPVIVEPSVVGAGPDRRGLYDNLISRLGAVWYDNQINSEWGFFSTSETTHQWRQSNWFSHAAISGAAYDQHTGAGLSVGFSRLAKIVGKKVEKPWILGFSYDGYYDSGLFGTDNEVYLDQMRGLIGYAICPCWDMGVWAAGGLTSRNVVLPANFIAGPTARYRASIGDRVAGYTAWHFGQTGIFTITSVGYQDNQSGNFFVESDAFFPLTSAINAYVGGGYSDNLGGSSDLGFGLEFTWGRTAVARALSRHFRGKSLPKVGMLASDTMAHGTFRREIDPCCVRYRGGWANDTYRSAFRIESTARLLRRVDLERIPNPVVVPQGEIPGTGPQGEPVCPKPTNVNETLVPRRTDRPTRPSRLSELQKTEGTRNPVVCREPVTPTTVATTNVLRIAK
jgi:hypothetical protein